MSHYLSQLPGSVRAAWQTVRAPDPETRARLWRGVLYGVLIGAGFMLAAGLIDPLALTDLPLRIEWPTALARMGLAGGAMAALMALIAWPASYWRGMLLGAAVTAFIVITVTMIQAAAQLRGGMLLLLFLLPGYSVLSLPLAMALRWVLDQHARNDERTGLGRWLAQAGLVLLVAGASVWGGTWLKMSDKAQQAVRRVDVFVQEAFARPDDARLSYILRDVDGFRAHAGVPYYLTYRSDPYSIEGFDVTVKFDDGYRLTCLALLLPRPSISRCVPGDSPYE